MGLNPIKVTWNGAFPEREVLLFLLGGEPKKNETPSTEALGVRHEYNVQSLICTKDVYGAFSWLYCQ